MKVTVTDKGEGYVIARYEAQSPVEAMMLSTCALDSTDTTVELKSETTQDWSVTPATKHRTATLLFHGFNIKVHSILEK